MSDETPAVRVEVRSIFGAATRTGLVELTIGDTRRQMTPEEAHRVAGMLHEAAEAAFIDAFVMAWLQGPLRQSFTTAAEVLNQFRNWRAWQTREE